MTNDLTTTKDSLPGLLPEPAVRALLASFSTTDEGRNVVLNRKPTTLERQMLSNRGRELSALLTPAALIQQKFVVPNERGGTDALDAGQYIGQLLALFFGNYTSMRGGDPRPTIAAYRKTLSDVPIWALEKALDAIAGDRIRVSDGRGGEKPLDRTFPPTAIQVAVIARTFTDDLHGEASKIIRVLRATVFERLADDDERRAAIPRVQKMAEQAKRALNWSDPEAEEKARAKAEQDAKDRYRRHTAFFHPPEKLAMLDRLEKQPGNLSPEGGNSVESTPVSSGGEATRPARKKKDRR